MIETGWGSSLYGYGKWGEESNVDIAAVVDAASTVTATLEKSLGLSAVVSASSSVSCLAGQVYFGASEISAAAVVEANVRFLWEPAAAAQTVWTKQAA